MVLEILTASVKCVATDDFSPLNFIIKVVASRRFTVILLMTKRVSLHNPLRPNPHDHVAVANSWFLCKQDAISNEIPLKIKMNCLKLKLEIVEALSASPPTNKSILADDEDNSVVIPLSKRSKRYNPPAIHTMAFILAIPG
ncbi:uncharacterized protein TNCV_2480111 [Trichonephila clavipes]|nr:uncharacterized protein TNCV_2480111 [Trichonephila clavipes]